MTGDTASSFLMIFIDNTLMHSRALPNQHGQDTVVTKSDRKIFKGYYGRMLGTGSFFSLILVVFAFHRT
jgi:hypothetical protein